MTFGFRGDEACLLTIGCRSIMKTCKHHKDGFCSVATHLARTEKPVAAQESTCQACSSMENPMAINKATCGLALNALVSLGEFDSTIHANILECASGIQNQNQNDFLNRPGSALRQILSAIGIKEPSSCYCQQYAKKMDEWGYDGCFDRRAEIIEHLNAQSISWFDMIKVGLAGYLTTGSLVDEALKRSKPKQDESL